MSKKTVFHTKEGIDKLKRGLAEGKTDAEIAALLGCSKGTIYKLKKAVGLVSPRHLRSKDQATIKETNSDEAEPSETAVRASVGIRKLRKEATYRRLVATEWVDISEEAIAELSKWPLFPFKGGGDKEFVAYAQELIEFLEGYKGEDSAVPQIAWDIFNYLSYEPEWSEVWSEAEDPVPTKILGYDENEREIDGANADGGTACI